MFALDVCVERIVNGKLPSQSLLVRESNCSKSLGNRPQPYALGSGVLLPLHIRSPHNQAEPLYGQVGDRIVLNDRFEGATGTAVIEFDCFNLGCIEGSRTLSL